jgi:prevent-host-death family protein
MSALTRAAGPDPLANTLPPSFRPSASRVPAALGIANAGLGLCSKRFAPPRVVWCLSPENWSCRPALPIVVTGGYTRIMNASVRVAKRRLSEFLDRAAAGEEIIITSGGRPKARTVALAAAPVPYRANSKLLKAANCRAGLAPKQSSAGIGTPGTSVPTVRLALALFLLTRAGRWIFLSA